MDVNSCRLAQGKASAADAASGDWRTQLPHELRQWVVDDTIMDILKRLLPISGNEGLNELRKIAARFEEKFYTTATSEADYLSKISQKIVSLDTKARHTTPIMVRRTSPNRMARGRPYRTGSVPVPDTDGVSTHDMPKRFRTVLHRYSTSAAPVQVLVPRRQTLPPINPSMLNIAVPNQDTIDPVPLGNQGQSLATPMVNPPAARQQLLPQNFQNNTSAAVQSSANLPSALSSITGLSQSNISSVCQTSNLQNMPGVSQNSASNSVGQGATPDIYANAQRQMQGRQQQQQIISQQQQQAQNQLIYQHQLQQQLRKQKLQHSLLMQPHMQQQQQQQQQQQFLLQPTQLQSSQQTTEGNKAARQQLLPQNFQNNTSAAGQSSANLPSALSSITGLSQSNISQNMPGISQPQDQQQFEVSQLQQHDNHPNQEQ